MPHWQWERQLGHGWISGLAYEQIKYGYRAAIECKYNMNIEESKYMMKMMKKVMGWIFRMVLWVNVWNFVKRAGVMLRQKMLQEG